MDFDLRALKTEMMKEITDEVFTGCVTHCYLLTIYHLVAISNSNLSVRMVFWTHHLLICVR